MSSESQITFDANKSYCGNHYLSKFGKSNLRGMRQKYQSLNGKELDTFFISHMKRVKDHTGGACSTHVEYFLGLSTKCCRVAFKLTHSIGNMRLQRIQL